MIIDGRAFSPTEARKFARDVNETLGAIGEHADYTDPWKHNAAWLAWYLNKALDFAAYDQMRERLITAERVITSSRIAINNAWINDRGDSCFRDGDDDNLAHRISQYDDVVRAQGGRDEQENT